MALYPRLLGQAEPKIPVHLFFAVAQEYALGNVTSTQARNWLSLSPAEGTEALALMDVILNQADSAAKRLKAFEFENVLILGEAGAPSYDTEAEVKARLGVA